MLSCMDVDNKSTTHRYTFKNKTLEPIIISDESDAPKPVFPNFVIPPDEIVTIENGNIFVKNFQILIMNKH